jgi:regulator of RNase E activity RraA
VARQDGADHGDAQIGGVRMSPGDIVVADDTDVCFIPIA